MPITLPNFIQDVRERWSLYEPDNNTNATSGLLSNNRFAQRANEVLVYWVREAVKANKGVKLSHNKGWNLRYPGLTVQSDGTLFFPRDMEQFIGVLDGTGAPTPERMDSFLSARRLGTSCGDYRLQGNSVGFNPSEAGKTRYVVYNSNLDGAWTAGTVSSATATALVPSATPTYASAPIVLDNDFYNYLEMEVESSSESPSVQRRRILDWDGTTFTMYGTSWPSWTPSADDTWGIVCPLDYEELLAHSFAKRTKISNEGADPNFRNNLKRLESQFYVSIQSRNNYGP